MYVCICICICIYVICMAFVCVCLCERSVFHEKKAIFLIYFFIFPANCIRIFSSFSCLQLVFPSFLLCCHFSGFVVAHCSNVFCIFYGTCNANTTTAKICLSESGKKRDGGKEEKFYFTLLWLSHFLIVVDKLAIRARAMSKCL